MRDNETDLNQGVSGLTIKWVRLAPNGTNPELFRSVSQNVLKSDLNLDNLGHFEPLSGEM